MVELINQLDDYTLTNQGDVGNKIRFEIIQLIYNNRNFFLNEPKYVQLIEKKLKTNEVNRVKSRSFLKKIMHGSVCMG